MEKEIDWKNAKYNPKRALGVKTEEQNISEFTKYCEENLSEVEANLISLDYDKTLAWLDTFGITDIAVANRIFSACKASVAAPEPKQEVIPEEPPFEVPVPEERAKPTAHEPHKAAHIAKPHADYSEEMSEFKKLEEDFLGRRL